MKYLCGCLAAINSIILPYKEGRNILLPVAILMKPSLLLHKIILININR